MSLRKSARQSRAGLLRGLFFGFAVTALSSAAPLSEAGDLVSLHDFAGSDGWLHGSEEGPPRGQGLVLGKGGILIGTTSAGGQGNRGTVFTLSPPVGSAKQWAFRTIHHFFGENDGAVPIGGVALDGAGNAYGFTSTGPYYYGGVYELKRPASSDGNWSETFDFELHGAPPEANSGLGAPLVIGAALYGASSDGTVFRLDLPGAFGKTWTGARIVKFTASEGVPTGGLTAGAKGTILVPTAAAAGATSSIFELTPPANPKGAWTKTRIYRFSAQNASVLAPLAVGPNGAIYGVVGGTGKEGRGEFFKLTPPAKSGGAWTKSSTAAPFAAVNGVASGGVVLGVDGRLYSFTAYGDGGPRITGGTVLQVTPPSGPDGAWQSKIEHSFTGGADGATPLGLFRVDASGDVYGLVQNGGLARDAADGQQYGWGAVFKLKP